MITIICPPCATAQDAGLPLADHECEDRSKPGLWYSGCPCACYTVPRRNPLRVTSEMADELVRLGWMPPPGESP